MVGAQSTTGRMTDEDGNIGKNQNLKEFKSTTWADNPWKTVKEKISIDYIFERRAIPADRIL